MKIIIKFLLKFLKIIIDEIYSDSGAFIFFGIIFALIIVINLSHIMDFVSWISLHDSYKISHDDFTNDTQITQKQKAQELYNQFISNLGWFAWTVISIIGLLVTLYLTLWGRKLQDKQWKTQAGQWKTQKDQWKIERETHKLQLKSHLQERYEKAASMLESEVMAVRIAGCRALSDLGIDESMKIRCARLLFYFLENPYLEEIDKKYGDFSPDRFFRLAPLRADIQEAANGFFPIYNKDREKGKGIDIGKIILPNYFLQNKYTNPISLIMTDLIGIRCKGAYLEGVNLEGSDLSSAILPEVNFGTANLKYVKMIGANLTDSDFTNADLEEANFSSADLQSSDLRGANLELAYLSNADLTDANLSLANLSYTDFENANLTNANLSGADLHGADLRDANFTGANLRFVNFTLANFRNANLIDADISGANMQEVEGLTPEQILSAIPENKRIDGDPPSLPEELASDSEISQRLTDAYYYGIEEEYDDDDDI